MCLRKSSGNLHMVIRVPSDEPEEWEGGCDKTRKQVV